jgi:hypothetical protein
MPSYKRVRVGMRCEGIVLSTSPDFEVGSWSPRFLYAAPSHLAFDYKIIWYQSDARPSCRAYGPADVLGLTPARRLAGRCD